MSYIKTKNIPFFQLMNQLPVASSALASFASDEQGINDWFYYLSTSAFFKYHTPGDAFVPLASPNVAPVTVMSMRYTHRRGFHSRVLSATSTSITIGGLIGPVLDGESLRVLLGTGQGQEKTLTWASDNIHESGVITGTTTSSLADSLKKWKINQWAGYLVHVQFGTDDSQSKRILYNDATTLYVADANLMPHNPWENQIFVAATPYVVPITTAGSQTHYEIRSQTFNVSAWDIIPDNTSFITTLTGGMYLVSSAAAAPFFTLQYYDVAADNWISKTCPQSLILAALGTDISLERTAKVGTAFITSTATSGGSRNLNDTSQTMEVDRYRNHRILITGGIGRGQNRRIVCNTATGFVTAKTWDINPDATSTYEIWPDFDRLYLGGNGASAMYANSPENDFWMQGQSFDDGITSNIQCTLKGWMPFGVSTGTRLAAGVTGINATPTAAGSGYALGDVLTCSVGGTGAQVIVTGITAAGGVTSIELMNAGTATGFTVGTGRATTGGTGTACTIEITSVGVVCKVTLATNHFLRTGQAVTFAGCTDALYNAQYTILCVGSLTAFDIITTAAANMAATASQSTTVIVDPSKNWIINEHAGRLVQLCVAGIAPTTQIRWIVSNTATSLTVATIVAGVNGTSKYAIYDSKVFGIAELKRDTTKKGYGHATGGSTTTLVDTSKNWIPNMWAGLRFKVEAGTGYGSGLITITSNTNNTLTFTTQTFTPDATTHYEIAETWGLMTAASITSITETGTKKWDVNQFAGKRVRVTGGTSLGQEAAVVSNTATALTTGTITLPDTTSTYAILEQAPRGAGIELIFVWGRSDALKGKYMHIPRGASRNTFDIYNITTERFEELARSYNPQQALFAAGTMYAYDGEDYIYIHTAYSATSASILKMNVKTNKIVGSFQLSGLHGTAIIGNRMEIITDSLGNDYLFVAQHTGTLLWRAVLFNI